TARRVRAGRITRWATTAACASTRRARARTPPPGKSAGCRPATTWCRRRGTGRATTPAKPPSASTTAPPPQRPGAWADGPSPSGGVGGGVVFRGRAAGRLPPGTARVGLGDTWAGYVVAAAARLVPVAAPVLALSWSGGGLSAPPMADTQTGLTVSRTY